MGSRPCCSPWPVAERRAKWRTTRAARATKRTSPVRQWFRATRHNLARRLRAAARATAGASNSATGARVHSRPVILFVGTSLTAGLGLEPDSAYPMLIQRKIDSAGLPFDVVNAGVSGETSAGLLDRLDWLLRGDVRRVGARDRRERRTARRADELPRVEPRDGARPDQGKASGRAHRARTDGGAAESRAPSTRPIFTRCIPRWRRRRGWTLLPFLLANVAGKRELNQGDGVHPNNAGERIVADNVWRALEPILRRVRAGNSAAPPLTDRSIAL